MQTIPREDILAKLRTENPWWGPEETIAPDRRDVRRRKYLSPLMALIQSDKPVRAVVVMGPRRVGKTWLLHHAIHELLANGVPAETIAYVSTDHPTYNKLHLEDLLQLLREAAGVERLRYVFFDEVQYLKNWEQHLKRLVEDVPGVKLVASGSAAAALRLKSRESGAGRFTEFLVPPLTFHEYLYLRELDSDLIVEEPDAAMFYQTHDLTRLNEAFLGYLNFGGYPEAVFSEAVQQDPARFIKSDIIEKVLLRDLPSLYGISDIQELNSLFTTLAYNTSHEVAPAELSQTAGVSKETLGRYIEYLEAAFLIKIVHRIDANCKRFQRVRQFKVYLTNPSMRAALFAPATADQADILGALAETAIYSQWFHLQSPLHYARWKEGEVDLVATAHGHKPHWATEVKWSDRAWDHPGQELKSLIAFAEKNQLQQVSCTTRTRRGSKTVGNTTIDFIPSSIYCYTVGRNLLSRFNNVGEYQT